MPIQVACGSCAKRFRADDRLAGKKVHCPACKGVIAIPASEPVAAATEVLSLLDESGTTVERRCPSCSRALGAQDVLCVGCGYDTRSGARVEFRKGGPAAESTSGVPKPAASPAAATASFVKGCVCSLVAVLIGSGIWYGVAMGTDREWGLIAWGLGVLAGVGMRLGYGKEDDLGGITAAFIACFGIVAAKWLIFARVLLPLVEAVRADPNLADQLPSTGTLFFRCCFGLMDGLFILFAFFTAYKVGSGKSSDD